MHLYVAGIDCLDSCPERVYGRGVIAHCDDEAEEEVVVVQGTVLFHKLVYGYHGLQVGHNIGLLEVAQ